MGPIQIQGTLLRHQGHPCVVLGIRGDLEHVKEGRSKYGGLGPGPLLLRSKGQTDHWIINIFMRSCRRSGQTLK